ncbi:MAG TPA: ElyC/SanA/YdcF family protein [Candidatus Saccharimonadales bacterium]|nr:ElyC/SanA/YdcF family protein [Candidatus Saccharimonadales bacterium]
MARWTLLLDAFFDSLCLGGPPRRADVIFVFAGRPERKRFGLDLWREGFAPVLVLSVGRYEWRRFVELGLPDDGGLRGLVERTPPAERHFFVVLRAGPGTPAEGFGLASPRATALRVKAGGLGTWREAEAIAEFLHREEARSVLVVSSAIHLRRAVTTLRALARPEIRIDAAAVPEHESSIAREGWWREPRARRAVLWEGVKLLLYRARVGLTALSGR